MRGSRKARFTLGLIKSRAPSHATKALVLPLKRSTKWRLRRKHSAKFLRNFTPDRSRKMSGDYTSMMTERCVVPVRNEALANWLGTSQRRQHRLAVWWRAAWRVLNWGQRA